MKLLIEEHEDGLWWAVLYSWWVPKSHMKYPYMDSKEAQVDASRGEAIIRLEKSARIRVPRNREIVGL